jgi:hypothetical protein
MEGDKLGKLESAGTGDAVQRSSYQADHLAAIVSDHFTNLATRQRSARESTNVVDAAGIDQRGSPQRKVWRCPGPMLRPVTMFVSAAGNCALDHAGVA